MNLGKLQDGEHGKRKKACGNRKKKGKITRKCEKKRQKLIDNDNFLSLFIYHVNEACSNLFESKTSKI